MSYTEQDVSAWSGDEVVLWLDALKLEFCKAEFIRKGMNGTKLLAITADAIKELDSIKGNEKKIKQLKKALSQLPGSVFAAKTSKKKNLLKFGGFGAKGKVPTQVRQSKVSTGKAVQSDDELDLTPMSKKNPPFPPPNHPESGDGEGEPDEIYDCVEEMEDYKTNKPPPPSQPPPPSDEEDDNQGDDHEDSFEDSFEEDGDDGDGDGDGGDDEPKLVGGSKGQSSDDSIRMVKAKLHAFGFKQSINEPDPKAIRTAVAANIKPHQSEIDAEDGDDEDGEEIYDLPPEQEGQSHEDNLDGDEIYDNPEEVLQLQSAAELKKSEPKVEPKVEPKGKLEPKVEPKGKLEPKVEPKGKLEPKVEPKGKMDEPKVEPKGKLEPKVEPKGKLEPKVEPKGKMEPKVEPKVEPKGKMEPKVEPKGKMEPKVELKLPASPLMANRVTAPNSSFFRPPSKPSTPTSPPPPTSPLPPTSPPPPTNPPYEDADDQEIYDTGVDEDAPPKHNSDVEEEIYDKAEDEAPPPPPLASMPKRLSLGSTVSTPSPPPPPPAPPMSSAPPEDDEIYDTGVDEDNSRPPAPLPSLPTKPLFSNPSAKVPALPPRPPLPEENKDVGDDDDESPPPPPPLSSLPTPTVVGSPALPKAGPNFFKSKQAPKPDEEKTEGKKKLFEFVKPAESKSVPPPPKAVGPVAQLEAPESGSAAKKGVLNRLTGKPAMDVSPLTGRHMDRTVGVDKIKQQFEQKNTDEPLKSPPIPQLPPKPQDKQESKGGEAGDQPIAPRTPVNKKGDVVPSGINKSRSNSLMEGDTVLPQLGDQGHTKKQGNVTAPTPNQTSTQDDKKKIRSSSMQGKEDVGAPSSPGLSRRGDRFLAPVPAEKALDTSEVKGADPKPLPPTGKKDEKEIALALDKTKNAPIRTELLASNSPQSPKSVRKFNQQPEAGSVENGSNNAPFNKPPTTFKPNAPQPGDKATSDKSLPGKIGGRPQLSSRNNEPHLPPRPETTKMEPPLPSKAGKDEPPLPSKAGKDEPPLPSKAGKTEPPLSSKVGKNEPPLPSKVGKDEPPLPSRAGKNEPPLPSKAGKDEPPLPSRAGKTEPPLPERPGNNEPSLPSKPKNEPPLPGRGKDEPPLPARPAKDPAPVPPTASDDSMKPSSAMSFRQSSKDDSRELPKAGRSIIGDKSQPESPPPVKEGSLPRQRGMKLFKLPSKEEPLSKDELPVPIKEQPPSSPLRSNWGGPSLPPKQSSKDDPPKLSKDQPSPVPPIKEGSPLLSRPTKMRQAPSKQTSKDEPPLPGKMEPPPISAPTRDEPSLPARPSKGGQAVPKSEPKLPANVEPPLPARPSKGAPPQPISPKEDPSLSGTPSNVLAGQPWYHGAADRKRAETLLKQNPKSGAFIVRDSTQGPEEYSLSLWFEGGVRHLRIRVCKDRKYVLGEEKEGEVAFESVVALVSYHKRVPLVLKSGGETTLTFECPK